MHQVVVLYPHPEDADAFRTYYVEKHLRLADRLPGLRSRRYAFDLAAAEGDSPYFCIFEAEFDDAEAFGAAMASPEGQAVAADLPKYATGGAIIVHHELAS
jgi:uncharacterized protein (TIGR02118 family)